MFTQNEGEIICRMHGLLNISHLLIILREPMAESLGRDCHKKEKDDLLLVLSIWLILSRCLMNVHEGNFIYPRWHKKAFKKINTFYYLQ